MNVFIISITNTYYSHVGRYDYDLVVVGGGSGGLACSKEGEIFCACNFILHCDFYLIKHLQRAHYSGTAGTEGCCFRFCGAIC